MVFLSGFVLWTAPGQQQHASSLMAPGTSTFIDVPPEHWAYPYIEAIAAAGVTAGYPDGTYRPNNPVTRAENVCRN